MRRLKQKDLIKLAFLLPAIVYMQGFGIFPFIFSLFLSFTDYQLGRETWRLVGFDNYINLLTGDYRFQRTFQNTVVIMALGVVVSMSLSLGFALLLNRDLKFKRVIRGAYLSPMFLPAVTAGVIWILLLDENIGPLQWIVKTYITGGARVHFRGDPTSALFTVVAVDAWMALPFNTIALLAGLQSMPIEPIESAKVDGANRFQIFRYITLPLLAPLMLALVLLRIIGLLNFFTIAYVVTAGGPGMATEPVSMFVYFITMKFFNFSYGCAAAYTLLVIAVAISFIYRRFVLGRAER